MKKDQLSTLIAIGFFAGTFVIAFSSEDYDIAAMRVLAFLAIGCMVTMLTIFWEKLRSNSSEVQEPHKIDTILSDAEKFSQEYGEVYVLADKLKKQRKLKREDTITGEPA